MKRTLVLDTVEQIDKEVKLQGWVASIRDHGKITFIDLRDRTGIVQCVGKDLPKITPESVVEIKGTVSKRPEKLVNKNVPTGTVEVQIKEAKVLSQAEELPIPVDAREAGVSLTKRLDWRWINLRNEEERRIFEAWTSLERGMREYLLGKGFIQIYPPSLMSTASESGAEVFKVDYFDREAFLAQSPQFYKQLAMAAGFEKVFMVEPVFRAEPSFTTRHVTEFTGWDAEISFIKSHHEVMDEEEKLLISAFEAVNKDLDIKVDVPTRPFPRITLAEAKEKLASKGISSERDDDVSPEEERELSKIIKDEKGHDFVFIIDWPISARPFYHMRFEDKPELTKSFDLLYKGLEITTGAQREHRVEFLEKQAKEKEMPLKELQDYLNFFRYGCPPHGGIGIGPGRIVMKMLDLKSVKEATFLTRDVKRLTP